MNKENIEKLAKHIEDQSLGIKFSMRVYVTLDDENENLCGSAACICGHALLLKSMEDSPKKTIREAAVDAYEASFKFQKAGEWLGIESKYRLELFSPEHNHADWQEFDKEKPNYISQSDAVKALRRVADGYHVNEIWDFKKEKSRE